MNEAAEPLELPRRAKALDVSAWPGSKIGLGESADLWLPVSESYTGVHLNIPIRVIRGAQDGPVVAVTAALHGDEINGTGSIQEIASDTSLRLLRGSLILVPVLNILSFDRHSRYLPDRRDLNRCFPGSPDGSSASRVANQIFEQLIGRCDALIDLHTAAVRRTNYPQVRGDMTHPIVAAMARAFGTEAIVDCRGVEGTLRRQAMAVGCPTIIMEGGEVWKVEPAIVETAVRGIRNVLRRLGMLDGELELADRQVVLNQTRWVRAGRGGFLRFHVRPGGLVERDQPLATNTDLLGRELGMLRSPFDGLVLGMTTLPSVSPGEPVCHIGRLPTSVDPEDVRISRREGEGLERRTVKDLGSNVRVVQPE